MYIYMILPLFFMIIEAIFQISIFILFEKLSLTKSTLISFLTCLLFMILIFCLNLNNNNFDTIDIVCYNLIGITSYIILSYFYIFVYINSTISSIRIQILREINKHCKGIDINIFLDHVSNKMFLLNRIKRLFDVDYIRKREGNIYINKVKFLMIINLFYCTKRIVSGKFSEFER